jgi:hypothetical protein
MLSLPIVILITVMLIASVILMRYFTEPMDPTDY